jgi:ethanolamine utilization protein EutA
MDNSVTLVGLDFGTTTSSAVVATASLICNSVTRRTELRNIQPRYDSEQVFTPYCGDLLDEDRLSDYLNRWLADVRATDVFGGGAMITGLAAQATNAAAFARQIRKRLKDAVIATAADPCLESWLAFMGNCQELSRAHPDHALINLDIGGGTTNVALGRNGEVSRTGSFFVGARHIQFVPGSYRITALSSFARPLLARLGINKGIGQTLSEPEVQSIVDWYLRLLESAVRGASPDESDPVAALHIQSPFHPGPETNNFAVTLSGGVGQLAYRGLKSNTWPTTTAYGDLGIDLARQLVERPFWRDHLTRFTPTALGRATLFGLLRHNTQVSGSTVYLKDPSVLPLSDLAIIGTCFVRSGIAAQFGRTPSPLACQASGHRAYSPRAVGSRESRKGAGATCHQLGTFRREGFRDRRSRRSLGPIREHRPLARGSAARFVPWNER